MGKVLELPTGEYDAVRTLRLLLSEAEAGEFNNVVVICNKRDAENEDGSVWAMWSDMDAQHVWWLTGWLTAFLYRRYFGGFTKDDD